MDNILEKAVAVLNELPGINTTILEDEVEIKRKHRKHDIDGVIRIEIDGKATDFPVEVKKELRSNHIPRILEQAKNIPDLMLITDKLYPKLFDALTQTGINYADATGRIFIKTKGIRIFTEGRGNVIGAKDRGHQTYTAPAVKIMLHLLTAKQKNAGTFRELGVIGNTALGNVSKVMNKLKADGLIASTRNDWRIVNRDRMFALWVEQYNKVLKPKIIIGFYRLADNTKARDWKDLHIAKRDLWGGEPGGALLTGYLTPQFLTIYTTRNKKQLIRDLKLIPDTQEYILTVYEAFWGNKIAPMTGVDHVAPPLIVYADLAGTNDVRNIETANIIFEKFIKKELHG